MSEMPVDFLLENAKKYLEIAKNETLPIERRQELVEIVQTLHKQAEAYLAATNEIHLSMIHDIKTSLRWKIYRWLFGVPYVKVSSSTINRLGQKSEIKKFIMNLEMDTLTYFINISKTEVN